MCSMLWAVGALGALVLGVSVQEVGRAGWEVWHGGRGWRRRFRQRF